MGAKYVSDSDYLKICKVKQIDSEYEANVYLDAGWILLTTDNSEDSDGLFVLGWNKENGDAVYPDLMKTLISDEDRKMIELFGS